MSLVRFLFAFLVMGLVGGCVSQQIRLPSSVQQVYKNEDMQQLLQLAASNNILFHIPEATVREMEKTEIDPKCREIEDPFWSSQLSIYLHELKKRPEFLTRFHILELKRGDQNQIQVQKDLDGATTVSIQFVKTENHGKVGLQTRLPCSGSLAEYLEREIIKTDFELPSATTFNEVLAALPERATVPRLQFNSGFLSYLAERGAILRFNHEVSFEKTTSGKYAFARVLDQLADEVKGPFHQHLNYWLQQISQQSEQADLIQMFGLFSEKEFRTGVKVESDGDHARRVLGQSDLTYLYVTFGIENDQIKYSGLKELETCLQKLTQDMSGLSLRKPASTERDSFLRPGYSCPSDARSTESTTEAASAAPKI